MTGADVRPLLGSPNKIHRPPCSFDLAHKSKRLVPLLALIALNSVCSPSVQPPTSQSPVVPGTPIAPPPGPIKNPLTDATPSPQRLVFSGAITASVISARAICLVPAAPPPSGTAPQFFAEMLIETSGNVYLLTLSVRSYGGPGSFTDPGSELGQSNTPPSGRPATIAFGVYDPPGYLYRPRNASTLTIDPGGVSGNIQANAIPLDSTSAAVNISGSWRCALT